VDVDIGSRGRTAKVGFCIVMEMEFGLHASFEGV